MKIVEEPRYPKFDPTPFVTYENEQDSTPTAAELVEDLPERQITQIEIAAAEKAGKPRRGKGYLRAEINDEPADSASDQAPASPEPEFGAGLTDEAVPAAHAATADPTAPAETGRFMPADEGQDQSADAASAANSGDQQASDNSAEEEKSGRPKTRRRRPRRRGRDRGKREDRSDAPDNAGSAAAHDDGAPTAAESVSSADMSSVNVSSEDSAEAAGGSTDSGDSSGGTRRRRPRRRNRRRRGKGGNGSSSGEATGGDSLPQGPSESPGDS